MRSILRELGAGQAGVFTSAQAAGLGFDSRALSGLVREQAVVRLGRGMFAVPDPILETAQGRHRALARAALLRYPDAALDGASALVAEGIPMWSVPLKRAWLNRAVLDHEVLTQSLVLRPRRGTVHVSPDGPRADIATAVVLHTLDHGMMAGVVAMDHALRVGLVDRATLAEAARRAHGWPRSSMLTAALSHVDPGAESAPETVVRVLLATAGLELTTQFPILSPSSGQPFAFADLRVDGTNLLLEIDGLVKYSAGNRSGLAPSEVVIAEKRREDRIRRLGWLVERLIVREIVTPGLVVRRVRRALAGVDRVA
jgi:hypothetical protein